MAGGGGRKAAARSLEAFRHRTIPEPPAAPAPVTPAAASGRRPLGRHCWWWDGQQWCPALLIEWVQAGGSWVGRVVVSEVDDVGQPVVVDRLAPSAQLRPAATMEPS